MDYLSLQYTLTRKCFAAHRRIFFVSPKATSSPRPELMALDKLTSLALAKLELGIERIEYYRDAFCPSTGKSAFECQPPVFALRFSFADACYMMNICVSENPQADMSDYKSDFKTVDRLLRQPIVAADAAARKSRQNPNAKVVIAACAAALDALDRAHSSSAPHEVGDRLLEALKPAIPCADADIGPHLLDLLANMAAFGFYSRDSRSMTLDAFVVTISGFFSLKTGVLQDVSKLHLHLVRACQCCIASQYVDVHGHNLVALVRLLFNIHISTTSAQVASTSQGSLLNVIIHTFSRISGLEQEPSESLDPPSPSSYSIASAVKVPSPKVTKSGAPVDFSSPAPNRGRGAMASWQSHDSLNSMSISRSSTHVELGVSKSVADLLPVAWKDALRLFRSFCSLAMAKLPSSAGGNVDPDLLPARGRVLALTLLQYVCDKCTSFLLPLRLMFGDEVRSYLLPALLDNVALRGLPVTVTISLDTFLAVAINYRDLLLIELRSFIVLVHLKTLQNPETSQVEKHQVLKNLQALADDRTCISEILCLDDAVLPIAEIIGASETVIEDLRDKMETVIANARLIGQEIKRNITPDAARTAETCMLLDALFRDTEPICQARMLRGGLHKDDNETGNVFL